jgi:DNA-binding transcriptional MerR regulator
MKKLYSATEVSRLLKVEPHVLRYWETKFDIRPKRNSAGRRIYNQPQLEKLSKIKFLRYQEKMTIKGVKGKLDSLSQTGPGKSGRNERRASLLWLKKELIALRDSLTDTPDQQP